MNKLYIILYVMLCIIPIAFAEDYTTNMEYRWTFDTADTTGMVITDTGNTGGEDLTLYNGSVSEWKPQTSGCLVDECYHVTPFTSNSDNTGSSSVGNSLLGAGSWTMYAWVKDLNNSLGSQATIIGEYTGADNGCKIEQCSGGICLSIDDYNDAASKFTWGENGVDTSDGEWHLITGVYNGTGGELRIDGVLMGVNMGSCTAGTFRVGGARDDLRYNAPIWRDEARLYDAALTSQQINDSYAFFRGSDGGAINVTIDQPQNNSGFGQLQIENNNSIIIINGTYNETVGNHDCTINDTWTEIVDSGGYFQYNNDTSLSSGTYSFEVTCGNSTHNGTDTVYFTIDPEEPIITPLSTLSNNQTIVWNGTLSTQINFSDNLEIYSINVTFSNGTIIFNETNMGDTFYSLNISYGVSPTVTDYINARVCDAHTNSVIKDIDRIDKKDNGLKFVIDDNPLWLEDNYIHIYPQQAFLFSPPNSEKKGDRYDFTFEKNGKPSMVETFYVKATSRIDIAKRKNYKGHLIIPDLGENGYWVDFENDESTKTVLTRIDDYTIKIDVYGLKSNTIHFNSIGELNCVTEQYWFNNLNPTETYDEFVLVNEANTHSLAITSDSNIVSTSSAQLYYNGTLYSDSSENFTANVNAPSTIEGSSTLLPFNWILSINGDTYNITSHNQNVSDFYIDNCTDYTTPTINFTIKDETNDTLLFGDAEGTFYYTKNGVHKSYDISVANDDNFSICIYPEYASLTGNYSLSYSSPTYPERRYSETNAFYTNVTQEIDLYLLGVADGIYVRFRTTDQYGNPITSVKVEMQNDEGDVVEQQSTDDSGLATFWVNPDNDYVFIFTKNGYETQTLSLRPTTSEIYNIIMEEQGGEAEKSYSVGISYSFTPSNADLTNNTAYDFIFNLTSDYWQITDCNLYLRDTSTTLSSVAGTYTSSTCNALINYNTGDNTRLILVANYQLNNTANITRVKEYTIYNYYPGQFSLKNFIDDLKNFSGAGFNDFTRMFIAFIVIAAIMLWASRKIGTTDPIPLVILLIALTWGMSYIGFLRLDYTPIPSEWLKDYIIALLISLGGGSFIIREVNS